MGFLITVCQYLDVPAEEAIVFRPMGDKGARPVRVVRPVFVDPVEKQFLEGDNLWRCHSEQIAGGVRTAYRRVLGRLPDRAEAFDFLDKLRGKAFERTEIGFDILDGDEVQGILAEGIGVFHVPLVGREGAYPGRPNIGGIAPAKLT